MQIFQTLSSPSCGLFGVEPWKPPFRSHLRPSSLSLSLPLFPQSQKWNCNFPGKSFLSPLSLPLPPPFLSILQIREVKKRIKCLLKCAARQRFTQNEEPSKKITQYVDSVIQDSMEHWKWLPSSNGCICKQPQKALPKKHTDAFLWTIYGGERKAKSRHRRTENSVPFSPLSCPNGSVHFCAVKEK